jgi:acetylornithine/N-succinyldiaminopimelate aminotransferase
MQQSVPRANSLMWINERPNFVFVRGEGSWLTDDHGKRSLDFVQGWAVNSLGHAHPALVRALAEQAALLINPGPAYFNEPSIALASRLTANSVFDRVFFANSGAEANEGAIKLARKWGQVNKGGAFEIITFEHGFHGRTLATMSATGKPGWDTRFAPQVPGFPKARLNDLASVEALIGKNTVAVMLEPVQGEAGVVPAEREFMRALRALTRQHELLLIVDEVQTGVGRTGTLFAYEHAGIEPDLMTLGKGLGGGVPLAALLAREECCCFVAGDQGGTFCGNPLAASAGLAVLDVLLGPGVLADIACKGAYLGSKLAALSVELGLGGARGAGLLQALVLPTDSAAEVVTHAQQRSPVGLLLNAPRPNLLRFMPSLLVTTEEIDLMVQWLEEVLRATQ